MGVQSAPWSSLFPLPSSVPPIHSQPYSRPPSPTPPAACPSCGSLPDTPCLCVFKSCMAFTSLLRCHYCHKAFSVSLVFEDIFSPPILVSLHLASAVLSTQEALPPEKRHLQLLPYLANTWPLCCYPCTFVWVLLMCVEMVDTRRQASI